MESFENLLARATNRDNRDILGAIALVVDSEGILISKCLKAVISI